jgi:hypothetical protein
LKNFIPLFILQCLKITQVHKYNLNLFYYFAISFLNKLHFLTSSGNKVQYGSVIINRYSSSHSLYNTYIYLHSWVWPPMEQKYLEKVVPTLNNTDFPLLFSKKYIITTIWMPSTFNQELISDLRGSHIYGECTNYCRYYHFVYEIWASWDSGILEDSKTNPPSILKDNYIRTFFLKIVSWHFQSYFSNLIKFGKDFLKLLNHRNVSYNMTAVP